MAKSRTIENYIKEYGESFYTKKSFIYVVNTGTKDLDDSASFDKIRQFIHTFYNQF